MIWRDKHFNLSSDQNNTVCFVKTTDDIFKQKYDWILTKFLSLDLHYNLDREVSQYFLPCFCGGFILCSNPTLWTNSDLGCYLSEQYHAAVSTSSRQTVIYQEDLKFEVIYMSEYEKVMLCAGWVGLHDK